MSYLQRIRLQPWAIAIAAGSLIALIALAGLIGLMSNLYVEGITDDQLRYAFQIEEQSGDLRVATLDVRYYHRKLAVAGPSQGNLAHFEDAYGKLHSEIGDIQRLGVRDEDAPQPDKLREMAEGYYGNFRPAISRYGSDPEAFRQASDRALAKVNELVSAADELDEMSEERAATALANLERVKDVERVVLLVVASGLVLALVALAYSAVRMLRLVGELRELYAREHAASEALAQASQAKTDFLADVSHELKTPLTVLRGNAELGLRVGHDAACVEVLEEVVKESGRMQRMIEDLLFMARSDAGSLPLELEEIPVASFLSDLAGRAEVLARERGASLEAALTGEGVLSGDPSRIEQAVLILVDNAAKYSPKGERVSLAASTGDGELCIEVRDRGAGIPKEELPHIFERFYRVGKMRTRRQKGAGLGLSIAKTIAEAHGGRIEPASRIGDGTRMTLYLPLSAQRRPVREPVHPDVLPRRAVKPVVGKSRVLVIEDDPGIADLLRRGLSSEDSEVTVAEDGSSGRDLWASGAFDLVMLDVMLPEVDGISLLAERRSAGDDMPVILLTARDDEDARERGMAAGATDYVGKPFTFPDLISRVELLLSRTEAR
jgi:two-component system, OmpR family, sensor histidine kinase VicK